MSFGMKAKAIKELHALGVRYAEKQGRGKVSLGHLKTAEVIGLLDTVKKEKESNV